MANLHVRLWDVRRTMLGSLTHQSIDPIHVTSCQVRFGLHPEELALSTTSPLYPLTADVKANSQEVRVGPKAAVAYRLLNWKERPPCKRLLLRAGRR